MDIFEQAHLVSAQENPLTAPAAGQMIINNATEGQPLSVEALST